MITRKIVVVGGGAGGLELVTKLGNTLGKKKKAQIILIDQNYNHLWKPLFHELAVGKLNEFPNKVNYLAHALNNGYSFNVGLFSGIDRKKKLVQLKEVQDHSGNTILPRREISYDILVIALGSISNDFGIPGVKENCFFLDNQYQTCLLRNKILDLFLKFSNGSNKDIINIAIVGGGATGIEFSTELYSSIEKLHYLGYKNLSNKSISIKLIEGRDRILSAFPLYISKEIHNKLSNLGIKVLINTFISSVNSNGLYTSFKTFIKADIIVWTTGIKIPDYMNNIGNLETNSINQLIVNQKLQTTRDNNIYAIGDCAFCTQLNGKPVPPRAQSAHQMASCVFNNILASVYGNRYTDYVYNDYGFLISLSKFGAIGKLTIKLPFKYDLIVKGVIARLMYSIVYRIHQTVIYGYIKTLLKMFVDILNRTIGNISNYIDR